MGWGAWREERCQVARCGEVWASEERFGKMKEVSGGRLKEV